MNGKLPLETYLSRVRAVGSMARNNQVRVKAYAEEIYDFHMSYRHPYSIISMAWLQPTDKFYEVFSELKEVGYYFFKQPLLYVVGDVKEDKEDGMLRIVSANLPIPDDDNDDDDKSSDNDDINVEESDIGSSSSSSSSCVNPQLEESLREVSVLQHRGSVNTLAFQPQAAEILATFSSDSTVYIHDLRNAYTKSTDESPEPCNIILELKGHSSQSGYSLSWCPSQPGVLASAGLDQVINVWDVCRGGTSRSQAVTKLTAHHSSLSCVEYHPSSPHSLLACDYTGHIYIWDTRAGGRRTAPQSLAAHGDLVSSVAWHPQGGTFASSSFDKTVKVYDVRRLDMETTTITHASAVNKVTWCKDRSRSDILAVGTIQPQATLLLWQLHPRGTSENIFHQGLLGSNVSDILFHPNYHEVVGAVTEDATVSIFSPQALLQGGISSYESLLMD